jgi:hypothetical protein
MRNILNYIIDDVRPSPRKPAGQFRYDINKVYEPNLVGANINKE